MTNAIDEVEDPITIADVEAIAKKKLKGPAWDYYRTGADDELTLARNCTIFDKILLRPQVLRNVRNIDTSTTIFGKHYEFPIAIAPTAYQKLAGGKGEIDTTRAAFNLGTNLILSTSATTSLEDVAAALPQRDPKYSKPWFQLYFRRSRKLTSELIKRAEKTGYGALVLTVDTVILGNRIHERRQPLVLPPGMTVPNMSEETNGGTVVSTSAQLRAKTKAEFIELGSKDSEQLIESSLEWDEVIPWLRAQSNMKIILKGIMTAEDAQRAVEAGVDAIVVSNHGGRQLDGVPSTLEALPEIADAVRGRIPVIFDGGIRRGTDVFKALALGADLCLVGRVALWGLAWDGQKGVEGCLHILERELSRAMALMGVTKLSEISRGMLGRPRRTGFGVEKL